MNDRRYELISSYHVVLSNGWRHKEKKRKT